MMQTAELAKKTKAELTALARRKKIPVTSGMLKDDLIKAIKKGLRKIETQKKSKTKKSTSKKKSTKTSKAKSGRKTTPKKTAVRKPKTARSTKAKPLPELPDRYGDHRLVVMARDPNWAYVYWDLSPSKIRDLLKSAGQTADTVRWILRVYSAALHPVEDKGHYFDVDVDVQGGNYYLNLSRPGGRFIVEIGVMDPSGMFRSTAQSNPVILPLDYPADTIAPESIFSEDMTSPGVSSFTKPPFSRPQ